MKHHYHQLRPAAQIALVNALLLSMFMAASVWPRLILQAASH